MKKQYKKYTELNLPEIDKTMLDYWKTNDIFERSMDEREGNPSFVFYEGPPSANGKPGIHHVLARSIKDMFCRYQTMKGKLVLRKAGWDTHGLPIELAVEKKLGITKEDIGKKISIEAYNAECKKTVMEFKDLWDDLTVKMGYWVDMEHPYITYENNYIESVWHLLQKLYNKDLLYKGYTIQPYSPAAGTGLSSHELNQPGCYREVKDTTVVAMFKVVKDERSAFLFDNEQEDVRILAWTTTPWTLPSNTALTVGGKIEYVKVKTTNPYTHQAVSVVLAAALIGKWLEGKGKPEIQEKSVHFTGARLENVRYEQLLPFGNPIEELDGKTDAFRVILGDFVTTEDGTGIVHTAPSFGADDRKAAKANGIGTLTLVDKQGKFVDTVGEFSGRYVKNYKDEADYKEVDVDIAVHLKLSGYAFNVQKYEHNYPHCWRTDKPILYYPLDSWFVAASKMKERMFELNQTINWKPAATGEGRFGNWLKNLQDWNLSRSRYWGIPLPIWRTADGSEEICIGSLEQLQTQINLANTQLGLNQTLPPDLHRPYIDNIVLVSSKGEKMQRELDLIDVWFDSGAMPYAQHHYPFESPHPKSPSVPKGEENTQGEKGEVPQWQTANVLSYEYLKARVKELRANQTPAEEFLWELLKNKQLGGFKFRRQHIIHDFIADFVCLSQKLVVEVDGKIHEKTEIAENDVRRSVILNELGYKVIRFKNEEVFQNTQEVLDTILKNLQEANPLEGASPLGNTSESVPPLGDRGLLRGVFPADFIAEGVDQTRGWFYTLHAIAVMCFDSVAYKNVVSNGLVLDKVGRKMSKRWGNAVEPFYALGKYGADSVRWYMLTNAQPWDDLRFSWDKLYVDKDGVEHLFDPDKLLKDSTFYDSMELKDQYSDGIVEVQRSLFGTLYNTYNFFATYANVDGFDGSQAELPLEKRTEIDRWIISLLNTLVKEVDADFSNYEPTQAGRKIADFVDSHLSNWYVRLCRRRFWSKGTVSNIEASLPFGEQGGANGGDKLAAYQTLYQCLVTIVKLMAPIAPFFADRLYQDLNSVTGLEKHDSVHLAFFPKVAESAINKDLEQRMDYAQRIASLVLSLRKREKVQVRQPLQKMLIPILDANFQTQVELVKDLILTEVNVKEIEYVLDTSGLVKKKIKPNFKTLGKKLGGKMKAAQSLIETFNQQQINDLEKAGTYNLDIEGTNYELALEDFTISSEDIEGWLVANDGNLVVALDMALTDMLKAEGTARELVNRIQNMRKNKGFEVTDRIVLTLEKHTAIENALTHFKDYICNEVLATELQIVEHLTQGETVELTEETNLKLDVQRQ